LVVWQASLQVLQFVLVPSGVSQPASVGEQSAKPVLHEASWQLPVEQSSAPFTMSHGLRQAPQFVSVVSGVSQPFGVGISESQSPKLAAQLTILQLPEAQEALACPSVQAVLHLPQLVRLLS
jgi:hypothetical protein